MGQELFPPSAGSALRLVIPMGNESSFAYNRMITGLVYSLQNGPLNLEDTTEL